jgi:hypothetical protein
LPVLDVIAQWRWTSHPHALLLRRCDLVPDAFCRDLPLELGEGQQDIEGEPSHRGGGVELLGDRDKRHLVPVEQLDHAGEVHQRPCQTVDLVDHDNVHLALGNVSQEKLEGRPLHGGTGDATIIVVSFISCQPSLACERI